MPDTRTTRGGPLVSVVIPVRNGAGVLGECLRAVRAQDYPRHRTEILVVDNGSIDATREVCHMFGLTPLEESEPGAGIARNRGIAEASGEIIAFTDADCVPSEDWLTRLVEELRDATAVQGRIDPWGPANRYARARAILHGEYLDECRKLATRGGLDRLDTANTGVRSEALRAAGGFHRRVFPAEDRELGARLFDRFGPVRFSESPRVGHRYEPELVPTLRKAGGVGRMWARIPRVLDRAFVERHFPDVLRWHDEVRPDVGSRRAEWRTRLAFGLHSIGAATAPTFGRCLRHYRAATIRAIRLGMIEELGRQEGGV